MKHARTTLTPSYLLNDTEAAAYLGVTPRYMRRLRAERRLPHYKIGRLVRWHVADLDAYLARSRSC